MEGNMYKDWKIKKEDFLNNKELEDEYYKVHVWCNESQANESYEDRYEIREVEEDGVSYYKTVNTTPPTEEELAEQVRNLRNDYLKEYVDPVVTNPLRWNDLSESEQSDYIEYRKYLLNIPQRADFPLVKVLTFDDWREQLVGVE